MKELVYQTDWFEKMRLFFVVSNSYKIKMNQSCIARVLSGCLVPALCMAAAGAAAEEKLSIGNDNLSQCEVVSSLNNFKQSPADFRIYFIGDSITRHGFNKETIAKLKWDHVAGMAASSDAKDYANLLAADIRKYLPDKKVRMFFGRGGDSANALKGMDDAARYQPQLVVVQLGEHVQAKDSREKISGDYAALLDALKMLSSKPLIVCTGVWDPQTGLKKYSGRTALIEEVQREVCLQKNIPFASVEKYALDPGCRGAGGSNGVRWHPNDAGHTGYARELFALFKEHCPQ